MPLKFIHKDKEADNIYSFYFQSQNKFHFLPGQYIYMTIPWLKNDYRGLTRHFTISSSPNEDLIRITTNIRKKSLFKQSMDALKKGDVLESSKPTGTFIIDEHEPGEHVLIAGGIGVTPFISIINYHLHNNLKSKLQLIYSVRSIKSGAFVDYLSEVEKKSDKISLYLTLTDHHPDGWKGLTGRMNKVMIKKTVNDLENKKFWLCGPPQMVNDINRMLKNMNIPGSNIVYEKFTGY